MVAYIQKDYYDIKSNSLGEGATRWVTNKHVLTVLASYFGVWRRVGKVCIHGEGWTDTEAQDMINGMVVA